MTVQNVLITSAGAKVLLVHAFKKAVGAGRVYTCDIAERCAAGLFSDGHFAVLPTNHTGAIEQLISLCRENEIGLIVPTRDGELPFFATNRSTFSHAGIFVLVPPVETVERCQNKLLFARFLAEHGFPGMPILEFRGEDTPLPAFVRPVMGAGSRDARRIDRRAQLVAFGDSNDYLLHPFIDAPEFTVDLLMDVHGREALQAVCRERINIVAGESKVSRVVNHRCLTDMTCRLGELLALVGHNTVQVFDDPKRGPLFIEVNPRFGGASNLSIEAGLDSPARILGMLAGDPIARLRRTISFGATMYRYSADVILREGQ